MSSLSINHDHNYSFMGVRFGQISTDITLYFI